MNNNLIFNLALNLALNNRVIYGATIIDTIEENGELDVLFKQKDTSHNWCLTDKITAEESCNLVNYVAKLPRKRMMMRATFIK